LSKAIGSASRYFCGALYTIDECASVAGGGESSAIEVAKPFGIAVHDHIIVGKEGHASFKGLKLI
jgi:hypothetical protein